MTAVLVMQCLVFGDGGLLALGANVLNMARPAPNRRVRRVPRSSSVAPRSGSRPGAARRIAALAFASWVATVVAAATCAGELALSRVVGAGGGLPGHGGDSPGDRPR